MKRFLLLFVASLHLSAFSQDWIETYSNENVLIEHSSYILDSPSDGIEHTRIIFRYTNRTSAAITISILRKLAYDLQVMEDSPERIFEISLPANSVVQYDLSKEKDKTFYIFSKDNKGTIKKRLTGFEILKVDLI